MAILSAWRSHAFGPRTGGDGSDAGDASGASGGGSACLGSDMCPTVPRPRPAVYADRLDVRGARAVHEAIGKILAAPAAAQRAPGRPSWTSRVSANNAAGSLRTKRRARLQRRGGPRRRGPRGPRGRPRARRRGGADRRARLRRGGPRARRAHRRGGGQLRRARLRRCGGPRARRAHRRGGGQLGALASPWGPPLV